MATYQEYMDAARNAHSAGDTDAARRLVQLAQGARTTEERLAYEAEGLQVPPADTGSPAPRPDTFGPTIRAATEGPAAATKFYANRVTAPDRTPLQRAGDVGMTGLAGLGTGMAFGAGLIGETFGGTPSQEQRLARDLMILPQVAVPELAGVSSTMRAAAPRVATPEQRIAQARDELDITPQAGTTGRGSAVVAHTLGRSPGGASRIIQDANRAVAETEGAFRAITQRIGNANRAELAGDQLQTSLRNFVDRFEDTSEGLYRVVDTHIAPETVIRLDNTAAILDEAQSLYRNNPELAQRLGINEWAGVLNEARDQGIPWQAARDFRTRIGNAINRRGAQALNDQDLGQLNRLYGGLSDDLEAAASAAGDEASRAWSRATRYHRAGRRRIDEALDKTITAQTPERAWDMFARAAREGGSADINRLRRIRASMPEDEWRDLSASLIDNLGKARPGGQDAAGEVFSPATFLTEWNKLSPQAKSLLVPAEVRRDIDNLALVAEGFRRGEGARDASASALMTTLTALPAIGTADPLWGTAVLGATVAGQNLSARAMTSRPMLRALNNAARGDMTLMRRLARGESPVANDARTVLQLMAAETAVGSDNANAAPLRAAQGR